jgi:hypothetical protein
MQYFRFDARAASLPLRAPLLERLLAFADEFTAVRDWRADAFQIIAPNAGAMPAVAAAAFFSDQGTTRSGWVCIASPVRYVAEMSTVRLPRDGILSLRQEEAATLALDFNRVWLDSGACLMVGASAGLYCVFDRPLNAACIDPKDVLGQPIEAYLPTGPDSARLRRLMSEMEMWLFEHAMNSGRTAQGLPVVNGLWLWGGGLPVDSLPSAQGFCAGDDVFFNALHGADSDTGVIAVSQVPGSADWQAVESTWLEPALEKLRARRISRLDLSAGDRCFSITARGSRRFWRRSKPWWESFP